ncbi:MAG: hypothetical protein ACFE0Q_11570 [Anaerolineae bacterium]
MQKTAYLHALCYANHNLPDNIGLRLVINASVMTHILINIGTRVTSVLSVASILSIPSKMPML